MISVHDLGVRETEGTTVIAVAGSETPVLLEVDAEVRRRFGN